MSAVGRASPPAGFSLVEILVALAVAAILSLALIAAQRRAFDMADAGKERWTCLNVAMAIMAETTPSQLASPTGGWSQRILPPEGEWRTTREYVAGSGSWQTLSARSGRTEVTFEWAGRNFTPEAR
ncbi:MAG: prepilin-type N-terminal cleavage/methylation domain-containing protein [Thermodesulfobacteriota bacterium]